MEDDKKTEEELSQNYVVITDTTKNWYQIFAIIILILYIICIFLITSEIGIDFSFATILLYLLPGIVLFTFIYGMGKIIQLLTQINEKLQKPESKKPKKKSSTKNKDLPWELQEDDN